MSLNIYLLFGVLLFLCWQTHSIKTVNSFKELAEYHCQSAPIELLYRLSTGQLSQLYGPAYKDVDCYIRQFVNKDGQDTFTQEQSDEDEEEQSQIPQQQIVPENDPLVLLYAEGLAKCLPADVDAVDATYSIWRFYRFIVQHDYALEWMRAKIRASLGYQAEKPNAWMDGEQAAARLRLDKLFSNQFYDYVDTLMFKDFLHPIVTLLKKNLVFAASGQITQSGKPILIQYIQTKNIMDKIFLPVVYADPKTGNIFTYTIPGTPLFLGGSTSKISWAFTGVLVDRSNIEQIQTLGQKFFHHGSETWIKLQNVIQQIKVLGEEPSICKFVHSAYGTLYEKHETQRGKIAEYIARWHQKQAKVRVVFSELFDLITSHGQISKNMQFPFSSLVLTNETGIFQYVCYQRHPSYFLYPDLSGAPEPSKIRWVSNPKRNFLIVTNTILTTMNQQSYIKRQALNPTEEQFMIDVRRKLGAIGKFNIDSATEFVHSINTDGLIKKRKDLLILIYRKAKFLFFPQEGMRKQCDQLIALLQKWNHDLSSQTISPIFLLWDYFFKQYTFNFASSSVVGRSIAKHKIVSDVYWTNQMDLWKVGTSYGECDSEEWQNQYRKRLNGTGQNSTCFFNIMRGINRTRQILRNDNGGFKSFNIADFNSKKLFDITKGYLGSHFEQAFSQFYSKNVAFSSEIGNNKIIYWEGYTQEKNVVDLKDIITSDPASQKIKDKSMQLDTDL